MKDIFSSKHQPLILKRLSGIYSKHWIRYDQEIMFIGKKKIWEEGGRFEHEKSSKIQNLLKLPGAKKNINFTVIYCLKIEIFSLKYKMS